MLCTGALKPVTTHATAGYQGVQCMRTRVNTADKHGHSIRHQPTSAGSATRCWCYSIKLEDHCFLLIVLSLGSMISFSQHIAL